MIRGKIFWIVIATVTVLAGCGDAPTTEPDTIIPEDGAGEVISEPAPAVDLPEDFGLTAVYVMGQARLQRGTTSGELHVGTVLQQGDRIQVAEDGFVELQSPDGSLLQLDAGTEIELERLLRDTAVARTQLYMHQGETSARVSRQRSGDRFTVRTRSAAAGVRGTAFTVTAYPDGRSRVAVGSGRVAVLPAGLDLESLYDQAGTDEEAAALVDSLLDAGVQLADNQELALEQDETQQQLARQYQDAAEEITRAATRPEAPLRQEVALQLQQIRQATGELLPGRELDTPSRQRLQRLEQAEPRSLVPAASVRISVATIPADARILIDGRTAGTGSMRGIFPAETPLSLRIERAGYQPVSFTPDTTRGGDYTVRLQAAAVQEAAPATPDEPPAAPAEPPADELDEPLAAEPPADERPVDERPAVEQHAAAPAPPSPTTVNPRIQKRLRIPKSPQKSRTRQRYSPVISSGDLTPLAALPYAVWLLQQRGL